MWGNGASYPLFQIIAKGRQPGVEIVGNLPPFPLKNKAYLVFSIDSVQLYCPYKTKEACGVEGVG